ncbi:DNA-binding transcriptional regulator MetR [Klebsiella pneumoniae]|nr:LysR family transcriptional regulator [Klebsiella pneumoniae]SAY21173.1 DNA-binding transcriptional regulator MetR [Klebsiella pneumoniae]
MDIPIELKHLQTLLALRKTGSLTRAAAAMQLTQSALSHQIKQLEEHYNVTLFMRKTSPVKFTLAGERLLHLAEIVLNAMEEANRDLYKLALGKQGALRITLECHTCYGWLLPVMDEFRKKWSEVEIDILPGFQPDPIGLLLQDRADVAIVDETEQTDLVRYSSLFKYEMVAILANEHPLTRKPWLEAEDCSSPMQYRMSASIFVEKYLNLPAFQLGEKPLNSPWLSFNRLPASGVLPHCLSGQYQNILKKNTSQQSQSRKIN